LVVKAAQDGLRYDAPNRLHRPAARCSSPSIIGGAVMTSLMPLLSVGHERTLRGNPPPAAIDPIADFGVM
jgi:hypothetical protein